MDENAWRQRSDEWWSDEHRAELAERQRELRERSAALFERVDRMNEDIDRARAEREARGEAEWQQPPQPEAASSRQRAPQRAASDQTEAWASWVRSEIQKRLESFAAALGHETGLRDKKLRKEFEAKLDAVRAE